MNNAIAGATVRPYPQQHVLTCGSCFTSLRNWSAEVTGLRLTSRITSPPVKPASSAGLPGCTWATATPCTSEPRCSCCRTSGVRSEIAMPSLA